MVKIITEFEMDIDDLQDQLDTDQRVFEYAMPENTKETMECLTNENDLMQFANVIDENDENFRVVKFEFESKAEKEEFEKWLKKKGEEDEPDDDNDDDDDDEED